MHALISTDPDSGPSWEVSSAWRFKTQYTDNMVSHFTIGRLARRANVTSSAIRYYERSGLLQPVKRSPGDYRLYDDTSVEQLLFIKEAQSAGFALDDIRSLLKFRNGATAICEEVRHLIERRLADAEAQMLRLQNVRRVLRAFLRACRQVERGGECPVLAQITLSSTTDSKKSAHSATDSPKSRKH